MAIPLPKEISDRRLDTIILLFDQIAKAPEVVIDFQRVQQISPAGHAILTALVDKKIESKCSFHFRSVSKKISTNQVVRTLLKSNERKIFPRPSEIQISEKKLLVQVMENFISPDFLDEMDRTFLQNVSEEKRWYVRLILNELMQNAYDHSTSERYYVYVGIEEAEIHFGVCDLGVTIPAKLEQKYQAKTDIEFLLKSLEMGVGTRRTRMGGLGLHHMLEILKEQQGRLVIVSRNAQMRKYFKRRKTEVGMLKVPLRGTWCLARMPLEE